MGETTNLFDVPTIRARADELCKFVMALVAENELLRMDHSWSVLQDDVRDLLQALSISDHARPYSAHEVLQREILPAIRKLTGR